jgi:hypothetical protein
VFVAWIPPTQTIQLYQRKTALFRQKALLLKAFLLKALLLKALLQL